MHSLTIAVVHARFFVRTLKNEGMFIRLYRVTTITSRSKDKIWMITFSGIATSKVVLNLERLYTPTVGNVPECQLRSGHHRSL